VTEREHLPNRRAAELVEFEHGTRRWVATIGRFDDGRLAEIFLHAGKDSPLLALAQDVAIVASIALQHGAPAAVIAHALAGRDAGPLAPALALIPEGQP
jgi:ribonucleoside-diphosphate reductase alpha chain